MTRGHGSARADNRPSRPSAKVLRAMRSAMWTSCFENAFQVKSGRESIVSKFETVDLSAFEGYISNGSPRDRGASGIIAEQIRYDIFHLNVHLYGFSWFSCREWFERVRRKDPIFGFSFNLRKNLSVCRKEELYIEGFGKEMICSIENNWDLKIWYFLSDIKIRNRSKPFISRHLVEFIFKYGKKISITSNELKEQSYECVEILLWNLLEILEFIHFHSTLHLFQKFPSFQRIKEILIP